MSGNSAAAGAIRPDASVTAPTRIEPERTPPGPYRVRGRLLQLARGTLESGVEQRRGRTGSVCMIEHHPGMMVLRPLGTFTHVEPLDALGQYDGCRERTAGQHVGSAPPGNPLQADQQRQLALH
jgi:hypothetical protein